jgi:hypothetical protein
MYISRHEQLSGCFKRNGTIEGTFTEPLRPRRPKFVRRRDGEGLCRILRVGFDSSQVQLKSLPISETPTNKVKKNIVRAQVAPYPNADGTPAIERFVPPWS